MATNRAFTIELTGELRALEALTAVSKHAAFAQKTAIRAAGRKGRSIIAKDLAARLRVPMKLFKHRVRVFPYREKSRTDPVAQTRLWAGMGTPLRASEHKGVLAALKVKHPSGFTPKLKSGHTGWFYRPLKPRRVGKNAREQPKQRHALPIKEFTLDYSSGTVQLVKDSARRVMKTIYIDTFRSDYKRRIDKESTRKRR